LFSTSTKPIAANPILGHHLNATAMASLVCEVKMEKLSQSYRFYPF
jgi:hypothetical protein